MSNEWKKQQNNQAATYTLSAPQLTFRRVCLAGMFHELLKVKQSLQHDGSRSLEVLDVMRKRRGNPNPCGEEKSSRLMFTLHPEAWRGNPPNEDPPDSLR